MGLDRSCSLNCTTVVKKLYLAWLTTYSTSGLVEQDGDRVVKVRMQIFWLSTLGLWYIVDFSIAVFSD